jgi:hypothetical protein
MASRIGAPTKLTRPRARRIADAISIGTPLSAAARYGGVTYQTYLNWFKRGQALTEAIEAGEQPELDQVDKLYLYFFDKVEEAKAEAAVVWANVIYQEAQHSPQWAAWMLQNWYPEQFGNRTQLDLTSGGEALPVSKIVDEALRRAYGEEANALEGAPGFAPGGGNGSDDADE